MLFRSRARLAELLDRLGGTPSATHARPRLVLAAHPEAARFDALWLVGGRVAHWAPLTDDLAVWEITRPTLGATSRGPLAAPPTATPDEAAQVRIATTWLAAHPSLELPLTPETTPTRVQKFAARALAAA